MHRYIHSYMHTYIHTYIHTCLHACLHAYIHTPYAQTNTILFLPLSSHMCLQCHLLIHVMQPEHVDSGTSMCGKRDMYTYARTHMYAHICICVRGCFITPLALCLYIHPEIGESDLCVQMAHPYTCRPRKLSSSAISGDRSEACSTKLELLHLSHGCYMTKTLGIFFKASLYMYIYVYIYIYILYSYMDCSCDQSPLRNLLLNPQPTVDAEREALKCFVKRMKSCWEESQYVRLSESQVLARASMQSECAYAYTYRTMDAKESVHVSIYTQPHIHMHAYACMHVRVLACIRQDMHDTLIAQLVPAAL